MEVFDRKKALQQVGGDRQLLEELVESFRNESGGWLAQLNQALEDGTDREVESTAHTIKGAADTIGATEVTEVARELEQKGRDGDLEEAAPEADRLREVVERFENTVDDEL